MAFSFGFSGDDIEEDPNDVVDQTQQTDAASSNIPPPVPARTHDLDELLSTLPDKISYSTITLPTPNGQSTRLPRRELFDIRLQLMAESDPTSPTPLTGLSDSDLAPNIYEGGFKTWECSIDLARHLLRHGPRKSLDDMARVQHVIEMGCGSALPSLVLFQYAVREELGVYFTLTDYNDDVLRLVTLPNLLLTWIGTLSPSQSAELFAPETGGNPLLSTTAAVGGGEGKGKEVSSHEQNGDIYLTPTLLSAFKSHLHRIGITLTFISGSWLPTPTFLHLVPSTPDLNTLILGSETIYSPASLTAFTEAIVALMGRVRLGKALVAAKKVYFGVGGSVDGFKDACAGRGAVAVEVEVEGDAGEEEGVKRWIGEVQMIH
ncbi:hypothetical protein T440DRAFT_557841 [Plenodomus tracheiphilus IPT5]|uniref:protein-histidine N-methyltransferase n=1 Tax=Plenodomus tracheiphilus IPT5 TaxID=1408161 RepID=A0A6A7AXY3_9PLEO|nr:hypothetical protein T440DRAFT_557841 [Plenodomus tracheiphilus IPT5]